MFYWSRAYPCTRAVDNHDVITPSLLSDCKEVFDLFDFWDGRDGLVDAAKVGDFLRSLGLNPTEEQILKNGGCKKMGTCGATTPII